MKQKLLLFLLVITGPGMQAQTRSWSWAIGAGGDSSDYCKFITYSPDGKLYAGGYYQSPSLVFGNDTLLNDTTVYYDAVCAQCDTAGDLHWAKTAGTPRHDYGTGAATDAAGNVYYAGYFGGWDVTFGSITLHN